MQARPLADLSSQAEDTLEAQLLTAPACSRAPGDWLNRCKTVKAAADRAVWQRELRFLELLLQHQATQHRHIRQNVIMCESFASAH